MNDHHHLTIHTCMLIYLFQENKTLHSVHEASGLLWHDRLFAPCKTDMVS